MSRDSGANTPAWLLFGPLQFNYLHSRAQTRSSARPRPANGHTRAGHLRATMAFQWRSCDTFVQVCVCVCVRRWPECGEIFSLCCFHCASTSSGYLNEVRATEKLAAARKFLAREFRDYFDASKFDFCSPARSHSSFRWGRAGIPRARATSSLSAQFAPEPNFSGAKGAGGAQARPGRATPSRG